MELSFRRRRNLFNIDSDTIDFSSNIYLDWNDREWINRVVANGNYIECNRTTVNAAQQELSFRRRRNLFNIDSDTTVFSSIICLDWNDGEWIERVVANGNYIE